MSTEELVWQDDERGLEIRIASELTDEVIAFLTRIVWGSRALRYTLPDLGERLAGLREPSVLALTRRGTLVSVCILDRCEKMVGGRPLDGFHFVMVATPDEYRNEGLAGLLIVEVRRFCERELRRPGIGFAYVESTTVFSLKISDRIGHSLSGEMQLVLFTRLWPSDHGAVDFARPDERDESVARLQGLYAGHEMEDFASSLDIGRYMVLREGGEIRAGVQLEKLHWSLVSLPGLLGRILMWLLPRIPFVKGRLNPHRLPLLRFGNLLVEPGREADLERLLGAALARHNSSLGMTMLDRRSEVLGRVNANLKYGVLSGFVKGGVTLRVDFVGLDDEDIAAITDRPLLASAADIF